MERTTFFRES